MSKSLSLSLTNSKNLSDSETSLESLSDFNTLTNQNNTPPPPKKKKKKKTTAPKNTNKKSQTKQTTNANTSLKLNLTRIKQLFDNPTLTFPIDFLQLESFLDKAFTNPFNPETTMEYSPKLSEIAKMTREINFSLKTRPLKSKLTKIKNKKKKKIKKIESIFPDNQNGFPDPHMSTPEIST